MKQLLFRLILPLILSIVPYFGLMAQATYHSPYSAYGIGTIMSRSSSLNRGMALTGIGLQDTANVNHINPASYASIGKPFSKIFEIGTYAERNTYETTSTRDSKSAGGLTNLSYWFKFSPKWSCVLGLNPFSGMSYNIGTTRELATIEDARYLYDGSGVISSLHVGNGFKITRNFSAGINVSYLFGTLEKTETVESTDFTKLIYSSRVFTNKADIDIGLQYRFKWHKKYITAGFIANNGLSLKGTRKGLLSTESGDTLASIASSTVRYKLPPVLGAGLAIRSKYSTIALDAKLTTWTKAEFADENPTLNDSWRISAGYVYGGNPHGTKFIDFVSMRAGVFYENYYMTLKNKNFANLGFNAGIAVPVLDGKSTINFNYANERLGTVSNGLILQHSHRFMIDVVIRDIWGVRRRFD